MRATASRNHASRPRTRARNPKWGYGVFTRGFLGENQVAHFKSKAAAETWARSSGLEGYKIKRSFEKDNPAESGAQYRLAQAVLDGTARSSSMTKKVAREIVSKTPAKQRSEYSRKNPRNPEASAAALSESWHGRPAKIATDYDETFRYHGVLTDLGRLQEIMVLVTERKGQSILFDAKTRLASSENGKQLYVVGGDQSLDLSALGIKGEEAQKDLVVVGEVHHLVYVTAKQHLGKADKESGPYQHKLGEESGVMPILLYDRLNKLVGFAGGNYFIDATDYDGKHSAGIRD
jgi:hypothetical protein